MGAALDGKEHDKVTIGVLAVHGSYNEHMKSMKEALKSMEDVDEDKVEVVLIRDEKDLSPTLRGLILPGGESTIFSLEFNKGDFLGKLHSWVRSDDRNKIFGTCAGLILLAAELDNCPKGGQITLGEMAVTVNRNFFGRQRKSFEQPIDLRDSALIDGGSPLYPGIFVRAPAIIGVDESKGVQVLASLELEDTPSMPVAVRQDQFIATSFHPELTADLRFHRYFARAILAGK